MNKIIKELQKHQKAMRDNMYPGYPYQNSIIIDCGTKTGIDHWGRKHKIEPLLNQLFAELLYLIIGHTKSTKPTWLQDRHISAVEYFTDASFNVDELYLDDCLAARFYLAIQSALCIIHDHHKNNAILWACIDNDCEFIDCRVFTSYDEVLQYSRDYLITEED